MSHYTYFTDIDYMHTLYSNLYGVLLYYYTVLCANITLKSRTNIYSYPAKIFVIGPCHHNIGPRKLRHLTPNLPISSIWSLNYTYILHN